SRADVQPAAARAALATQARKRRCVVKRMVLSEWLVGASRVKALLARIALPRAGLPSGTIGSTRSRRSIQTIGTTVIAAPRRRQITRQKLYPIDHRLLMIALR